MSRPGNPCVRPSALDAVLLRYPRCLWRGEGADAPGGIPVGRPLLEEILPGGGWPAGTLVEVVCRGIGGGELHLFLPAMRHVAEQGKCIAWIRPPHLPYAPALAAEGLPAERSFIVRSAAEHEGLWAFERVLRSPECGLALFWPDRWSAPVSRRLRLAAAQGGGLGVVFLRAERMPPFSFATLRLALQPGEIGLGVRVLKAPGGRGREIVLPEV